MGGAAVSCGWAKREGGPVEEIHSEKKGYDGYDANHNQYGCHECFGFGADELERGRLHGDVRSTAYRGRVHARQLVDSHRNGPPRECWLGGTGYLDLRSVCSRYQPIHRHLRSPARSQARADWPYSGPAPVACPDCTGTKLPHANGGPGNARRCDRRFLVARDSYRYEDCS